jgi:hypothetical protein
MVEAEGDDGHEVEWKPRRSKPKRGKSRLNQEMLKNSLHGIFQLGSSRSEFATASANQRLTSLFALGHPCPKQEALIKSALPSSACRWQVVFNAPPSGWGIFGHPPGNDKQSQPLRFVGLRTADVGKACHDGLHTTRAAPVKSPPHRGTPACQPPIRLIE